MKNVGHVESSSIECRKNAGWFQFQFLRYVIGWHNLRHFVNQ